MLKITGLTVAYDRKKILRDINLHVAPGETLAVVGESGTGKTTLGMSLMGLLKERSDNVSVEGEILLDGTDVAKLSSEKLRGIRWTEISMVFQNTDDALNPVQNVLVQVREPLLEHGICQGKEADERARNMLERTGLPVDRFDAYPHQLSTGEKQRALIAMAMVCDPEVIILDEPTSSLDAVSKKAVNQIVAELCRDKVSLIITHDLGAAASLADRVAFLCGGQIVEIADTQTVFTNPRHPYSRGLIRCYPDMDRSKDLQGIRGRSRFLERGCPFFGRCTQAVDICAKQTPPLRKVDGRLLACLRGGVVPFLTVKDLSKSYDGELVLDGINLTVFEGETLALVGESGSGKTTLARCVVGLLEADRGELELEEKKIQKRDRAFHQRVQLIFQNPREAISHRMNVLEAVREPLDVQKTGPPGERKLKVKAALRYAELPDDEDFLHRYPHHLSGGEIQRVVIARALVLEPEVLIADEPTSFLDASVQAKIIKLLNNLQEERGLSMLFITHDIALARKSSDRIAVLNEGRIVETGPTGRVLSRPSHPYTRSLADSASHLSG
ncbi:MAG: ABC transporter ATP-binding protein [Planctomycetes bacterium]|nr:ABC transporter ATP-binding protein [Planctomycetota bacterium]